MATSALPLAMQMVIKRNNFEWSRDQHGNYRIEDPVIKSFYVNDPARRGVYVDRKLDKAVADALAVRKEHDAEMTKRSGFSTEPVKVQPMSVTKPAPKPVVQPQSVTPPPPPARKPRVVIDDDPVETLELDDVELDNTGQRLRNRTERVEPRRSKKVSVYLSAAQVLVKQPGIGQEALAVQAKMAMASAKITRVAWRDILATLRTAGCLNATGLKLIDKADGK